ncbi:MAG: glycosyltransferase [Alphaproteobacteria bacterium]|nr:glycosyltransferase [Alphaproteobacteria bacterium]
MARPEKTVIAFTHGQKHPSTRFRILQYEKFFERQGWKIKTHNFWPRPIPVPANSSAITRFYARAAKFLRTLRVMAALRNHRHAHAILVNREAPSALFPFLKQGKKLIVDFDDAVYLGSEGKNFAKLCQGASRIVAGNATLAAPVRDWNMAATIIPTVVDPNLYHAKKDYALARPARIGWIGSSYSIQDSLFPILPLLADLQRTLSFELVVISHPRPIIQQDGLAWRFLEWSPQTEANLADLIDIGIMPLEDTDYQRGKCGAKLLQYMAASIPAVASPFGVNTDIIRHGETGLLAQNAEEWRTALTCLMEDINLRTKLGKAGQVLVCSDYSVERWGPVWTNLLDGLITSREP